jgi:hypothetical protein
MACCFSSNDTIRSEQPKIVHANGIVASTHSTLVSAVSAASPMSQPAGASRMPAPAPTVVLTPVVAKAVEHAGPPLRIVAISDTHELHWELSGQHACGVDFLPPGDVLVHCGDIFRGSRKADAADVVAKLGDFNDWLGTIKDRYRHGILVIAGNHDIVLQRMGAQAVQNVLTNATYLEWSGVVVAGVSFFGCPLSFGRSCNRGFQDHPADFDVRRALPSYVDVLISHGSWANAGWIDCVKLPPRTAAPEAQPPMGIRCRLNLAGHDHDEYGARTVHVAPVYAVSPGDVANAFQSVPSLAHPSFPLPQVAGLGVIEDKSSTSRTYRHFASAASALTGGLPSQPEVVDAVTVACNKQSASQRVAVSSQTVCVVASTLDMRYLVANRPVEIDLWTTTRQQQGASSSTTRPAPTVSQEYQRILVNGVLPVPQPRSSRRS